MLHPFLSRWNSHDAGLRELPNTEERERALRFTVWCWQGRLVNKALHKLLRLLPRKYSIASPEMANDLKENLETGPASESWVNYFKALQTGICKPSHGGDTHLGLMEHAPSSQLGFLWLVVHFNSTNATDVVCQ